MDLKMKQAVQWVSLDGEGSPSYKLDMTDEGINRTAPILAATYRTYEQAVAKLRAGEKGAAKAVSDCYRAVIETMLGKDAYKEITAWCANGEEIPAEQMNSVLSPLVIWLFEQFGGVLTANRMKAAKKYLDGTDQA